MRSNLVTTGVLIIGLGVLMYVLDLPFAFAWSLPLMGGGLVFALAGLLTKESTERVEPPPGHEFCAYCSNPVLIGAKRCDYCGGLQDQAGRAG